MTKEHRCHFSAPPRRLCEPEKPHVCVYCGKPEPDPERNLAAHLLAVLDDHPGYRTKWRTSTVAGRPKVEQITYVCTCGATLPPAATKRQAHREHLKDEMAKAMTRPTPASPDTKENR